MTRGRLGAVVIALALVASACSSASSTVAPGSTTGPTSGSTGGPAATNTPLVVPSFVMPAGGNGACNVSITGVVTKSWTAKQDMGTLAISQWLSASSRSMLSLKAGEGMFIMNCKSDAAAVDFTSVSGTTEAQFPSVGEHAIGAGGALGGGDPGQISVLVNLHDSKVWHVSKAGTFTVTKFGGSKFVGSFKATISSDAGEAALSGSFDLSCTGDACN